MVESPPVSAIDEHPPSSPEGTQVHPAEATAEAVRTFLRAVRTLRTYPIANEMSLRALADLAPRLTQVLPLTLELESNRLHSEGTTLTDEKGLFPPLVADLYRDGVRRLRLERGLPEDELRRLLVALAQALDPSDLSEDYVTRLWEAHLPHVRIFAVDPYLNLDTPDEVLEGKAQPASQVEEEVPEPELKVPPPPDFAFRIEPDERARVAQEVEQAATSEHWGEFIATLFETAAMPAFEQRSKDLVEIFEAYFYRLVRELRLELAVQILKQLRSIDHPAATLFFRPSLVRIAQADRLAELHGALESGVCSPGDAVSLLVLLEPESVGAVCKFLEQAGSERLYRLYGEVLTRIGGPAIPFVVERFRSVSSDARRTYARVLGGLESEVVVSTLLDALSDPDPAVRREVVRAVAAHKDPRGSAALLRLALEDPESESRIIALRGLEGASTKIDEDTMLQRIRSRPYRSLPSEEKDLLFRVLSTVGNDGTVVELQTLLRRSWIPGRTRRDDWPRAASALARLATPAALEVLEAKSKSRNGELASVCAGALRSAKKGKP